jgi:hypothetical protein
MADMTQLHKLAALTTMLLWAPCGTALANQDEMRLVGTVFVNVEDKVTDGCLPQPKALKDAAELILRRSGVLVSDELSGATNVLNLGALGWARRIEGVVTDTCDAVLDVSLFRYANAPEGHVAKITAYGSTLLQSGFTKPDMQVQLRNSVSEAVTEIANEILKARQAGD